MTPTVCRGAGRFAADSQPTRQRTPFPMLRQQSAVDDTHDRGALWTQVPGPPHKSGDGKIRYTLCDKKFDGSFNESAVENLLSLLL